MEESSVKTIKRGPFEKRIHEIDFLRGLLILIVILDHIFYNLGYYAAPERWNISWMYGFFRQWYWFGDARQIIQPMALLAFCFISGVSSAFSRNNWRRAIEMVIVWLIIASVAALITLLIDNKVITFLGSGSLRIDFNIIGVLAVSTLIYCFIQKRTWKILLAGTLIAILLSSYFIPAFAKGMINCFGALSGKNTPDRATSMVYPYGTPSVYMPFFWEPARQSDYVPLFPFVAFFILGALVSYFVYREKKQSIIKHKGEWERPICFVGRHTLVIYLTHELILMGLFALINLMVTGGK